MSDNVKINITEIDKTTTRSSVTDSTDIAFVPGYAGTTDGKVTRFTDVPDVPTLCYSVKEFEKFFGPKPFCKEPAQNEDGELIPAKYELGYIYAKELLNAGMPVLYYAMKDGEELVDVFNMISDRGEYSVKYITSGGTPSLKIDGSTANDVCTKHMLSCASSRGDAVALVDTTNSISVTNTEVHKAISDYFNPEEGDDVDVSNAPKNREFGAAMYPWATYFCPTLGERVELPASFGYLMCVAKAIKTSPNWLAMAGVTRGLVPNIKELKTCDVLTNSIAEDMQPKKDGVSVNCITNIRPYGLTLWGNRTLLPVSSETKALNFLNIRNMISDVKKLMYTTAKSLMFEQNSDTLWIRFKAGISPLLEQLKSGNAISDYKIIKSTVNSKGEEVRRGEIAAIVRVYPIYAVEYFDLTVEISDEDVAVDEQ